MDSTCGTRQSRPGSIPVRAGYLTAKLPESSSQGTSIDLQSTLTLLLSRMDTMNSNIVHVTKTTTLLHERIVAKEQDKVSVYPNSSEN